MPDDTYIHGHHDSVLRSHRWRTAANSAAYLLPHLKFGMTLLDVGCGPGNLTVDLAERLAPGTVLAVDRSEAVLAEARATAAQRGARGTVTFAVGDVYDLDVADGAFDVVHAHQVLQHLSDPVRALREMRRVATDDGLVAARDADYAAFAWYPQDPALTRWLQLYQAVARSNHAEPDAGRRLLSWARAAGFADIEPSASVWCFATERDRRWWGDLWAERAVASDFAAQAREHGLATDDDLAAVAAAWRRWADHDDGWLTIVHGEIICRG
jgi:ubiquinone/menaquinone biosynthesis C-methylase UbiE